MAKKLTVGDKLPKGTIFYKKVYGVPSGSHSAKGKNRYGAKTKPIILTMEMVEPGIAAQASFMSIGMKVRCGHVKVLAITDKKGKHLTGNNTVWSGWDHRCTWTLGKRKKIADFDVNSPGCGIGIHGFMTFRQATRY